MVAKFSGFHRRDCRSRLWVCGNGILDTTEQPERGIHAATKRRHQCL